MSQLGIPSRVRAVEVIHGAGIGGTERHVRSLLEGLPALGVDPVLLTSREGDLCDCARDLGLEAWVIPRSSALGYLARVERCLRDLAPDVVHAHSGRLPCLAARRAGVPRILETRHGARTAVAGLVLGWPLLTHLEGWKCRLAHRTIAVCESDRDWLIDRAGLPSPRVRVVPNGIPVIHRPEPRDGTEAARVSRGQLGLDPMGPWIGYVGRLAPEKAPGRILTLLAELRRLGTGWRALIVGDGPMAGALRAEATRLGISDAVTWLGADPRGELAIRAVDCICLPSRSEGLSYVLLEALAAGVPLLATPVGGAAEVLAGPVLSDGCMEWDLAAWTQGAVRALNPSFREGWFIMASRRVEHFSEERMLRELVKIYRAESLGFGSPASAG